MIQHFDSVLHLGDPAFTASNLVSAAKSRGLDWDVLNWATPSRKSGFLTSMMDRAIRGARWELSFAKQRMRKKHVHLHSALAINQVRWALGKYTLHLHGTDIRSRLYDPAFSHKVKNAVNNACTVLYATPDLAEHVHPLRDDAILIPVPVAVNEELGSIPQILHEFDSYVFFTSRWEDVKGGAAQLNIASVIRKALPRNIGVVGLDWGPLSKQAQDIGVTLIPKLSHKDFSTVISIASVCIGQFSGVMGASELDALARNTPLVMPLKSEWYSGTHPSLTNVPVLGGTALSINDPDEIVDLVKTVLSEENKSDTLSWVLEHHSPEASLDYVLAAYNTSTTGFSKESGI